MSAAAASASASGPEDMDAKSAYSDNSDNDEAVEDDHGVGSEGPSDAAPEAKLGYAKLVAKEREHVITALAVTLGRQTHSKFNNPTPDFIPVGSAKNISRKHAVMKWEAGRQEWALYVYGKNGVAVDGEFFAPGAKEKEEDDKSDVPVGPIFLRNRAHIRIEDSIFFFLLPIKKE